MEDDLATRPYDHRNCSSLFGYSAEAHARSGGICRLCGCGGDHIDFDLWRQFTVEHLIGEGQGGYLARIRIAVAERFPNLDAEEHEALSRRIDAANTVSACSFCNATTSRDRAEQSMAEVIAWPGGPDEVVAHVVDLAAAILDRKRRTVAWKMESVRAAFDREVRPSMERTRAEPSPRQA